MKKKQKLISKKKKIIQDNSQQIIDRYLRPTQGQKLKKENQENFQGTIATTKQENNDEELLVKKYIKQGSQLDNSQQIIKIQKEKEQLLDSNLNNKDYQYNSKQLYQKKEEFSSLIYSVNKLLGILKEKPNLYNVKFYLGKIQSIPYGDYIDKIHNTWFGNYDKLEIHHGYVQWLFPNFFKSRFNNSSYQLLEVEADMFRNSPDIAQRLFYSYNLILDFFGIDIVDSQTGELKRSRTYYDRYKKTFIQNPHNLMRVTRILANMNVCGFRLYAVKLVQLLEKEIYGQAKGYTLWLQKKLDVNLQQNAPLKQLAGSQSFEEWIDFGEIDEQNKSQVQSLERACLNAYVNIKQPSIFFKNQ